MYSLYICSVGSRLVTYVTTVATLYMLQAPSIADMPYMKKHCRGGT